VSCVQYFSKEIIFEFCTAFVFPWNSHVSPPFQFCSWLLRLENRELTKMWLRCVLEFMCPLPIRIISHRYTNLSTKSSPIMCLTFFLLPQKRPGISGISGTASIVLWSGYINRPMMQACRGLYRTQAVTLEHTMENALDRLDSWSELQWRPWPPQAETRKDPMLALKALLIY
jgi:hypothetical protein